MNKTQIAQCSLNAPMYRDLNEREILIYQTGYKNGFAIGKSDKNITKIKIEYKHNTAVLPVNNAEVFAKIVKVVCHYYQVPTKEIYGKSREGYLIPPRSMIINLARECTTLSYPELGHYLNKDHTTLLYHVKCRLTFKGIFKHDSNHNVFAFLKSDILAIKP